MTTVVADVPARPAPTRRPGRGSGRRTSTNLTPGSSLALGISVTWFSILVLIPLAAVVVTAAGGGWDAYVATLTNPQTWAAIKLTVFTSVLVTLVNVVVGTVIAWELVRDRFWGKRALDVVIDIPFALPTIVAGLVLLSLYGKGARSESTGRTPRRPSSWRWRSSLSPSSCARCSRC